MEGGDTIESLRARLDQAQAELAEAQAMRVMMELDYEKKLAEARKETETLWKDNNLKNFLSALKMTSHVKIFDRFIENTTPDKTMGL